MEGIILDSNILPMIALRGKIMLPGVTANFDIGRLKSLNAVNCCLDDAKLLFVVGQKDGTVDEPTENDVYDVGTVCRIKQVMKMAGENIRIVIEGVKRAKIVKYVTTESYFSVELEYLLDIACDTEMLTGYTNVVKNFYSEYIKTLPRQSRDSASANLSIEDSERLCYVLAFGLPLKESVKQSLIESDDLINRLEILGGEIHALINLADIEAQISEKVKRSVEKNQKEYYLREQIKAIHEELGDDEDERIKLEEAVKAKSMSKDVEDKVLKELLRMSKMNPSSPDYAVLRTYVDWIIDLPFNEHSTDRDNILDAEKILDEDHYGLEKVKERIVEYLAVMKLTNKINGPILCLVGPPGVGKTSIASSIARALDRKLVRMSLGGVKDEAEIRGHRKTYIGAMPGRIMFGLKEAGTINPVFLLDEIDKVSSDMRGDPASALLEVLDPEQNKTFRDRYLEIPYDLSKVLFITTANDISTIPTPLLDRMEVIEIQGYTREEKVEIAKKYLLPKEIVKNGLESEDIILDDECMIEIIDGYTKEAGVRNLEREIGSLCRKTARIKAEKGKVTKTKLLPKDVEELLGVRRYLPDSIRDKAEIGVATGLAWTAVGGTTLSVEAKFMTGKGGVILTGHLGDVMQESAKTAVSYIKTVADEYGIDKDFFEKNDVHLHFPEGAVPKDGPSAGITIATAILSALTNKPVRLDIAMTGEITLLGRVLPIGGLKEKSLAAYRLGINKLIIPEDNAKDVEDIPKNIRDQINYYKVNNAKQVFEIALAENGNDN